MSKIISMDLAHRIWTAHREIEVGTKLLADIDAAMKGGGDPTPIDAYGRRQDFQLGVPSGHDSKRLFNVPATLAASVINSHIECKREELVSACQEALTVLIGGD